MLEEQIVIDQITILEDGQIQVRKATRVLKDGVKIAETYHRHVLSPGADLANEDPKVVAQATTTWTEDVISAWNAKQ